jgi:hypothetical protein
MIDKSGGRKVPASWLKRIFGTKGIDWKELKPPKPEVNGWN